MREYIVSTLFLLLLPPAWMATAMAVVTRSCRPESPCLLINRHNPVRPVRRDSHQLHAVGRGTAGGSQRLPRAGRVYLDLLHELGE